MVKASKSILFTFFLISIILSAQEMMWISSDSLLFSFRRSNKYVRMDAYSDRTTPFFSDSVLLPNILQNDKSLRFSAGRFAHGKCFLIFKSDKARSLHMLEYVKAKKSFQWQSNLMEQTVNEWFGPSALRFFNNDDQYLVYWIQDSGNKRFFLNKLKYSPDNERPIRYENVWQYDFQHRKVKDVRAYGLAEKNFILNVYVEDGTKKGWWTLALNDETGKVKYYRRLTRDNDSLTNRLEYFVYDTVQKQYLVITGKNYTLKDFGRNKKEIRLSVLDTSLDVLRTWTLFVNTNTKVMKDLKIEYVQPMHYAATAINDFEYSISAWGWGKKNGFYFPVAFYERSISADNPIVKTSINTSPTDILMKELSIYKNNMDTLPLHTEIKDFTIYYPFYSDTSVCITMLSDMENKYVCVLKPYPSTQIATTTFLVEEKIKFTKDEPLALLKSRYFVWVVNQKNGRLILARKSK